MSDPELRDPRLDQAYRELPGEAPPPEVDERLSAAARRAVGARPQSLEARQRSWASRWRVPLSLAASVVVVVTLTLMMQEEEHRARSFDSAPAPQVPATFEDHAPPRAAEETKRPDVEGPRTATRPGPARSAPPAPEPMRAPAAAPKRDAVTRPPPEPPELETRQQRAEEAAPAGAAAPRTVAPAAAPPAPAPGAAPDSLSRERAVGDRPARAMRSAPQAPRSPDEWIEEIRRLRAQGRDADAATELAEFRRRHPDYPLPVDLAR